MDFWLIMLAFVAFVIGSIPLMLEAVDTLPVTDEQREGIRWKNAAKLLGLEQRVGR